MIYLVFLQQESRQLQKKGVFDVRREDIPGISKGYRYIGLCVGKHIDVGWGGVAFIPARVAGVHGNEHPKAGLDHNVTAFERNARVVSFQCLLDRHNLLAYNGKHLCRLNREKVECEGGVNNAVHLYSVS